MKVGDVVVAKKSRIVYGNIHTIKGKSYIITDIKSCVIQVSCEKDSGITAADYRNFIADESDHKNFHIFSDYFYNTKELRNLKLKKLKNEINR